MSGIFDFLSGNANGIAMTPEQVKAMELYRAGQASVPVAAPAEAPLRIGVDPVATQQQSRVGAQQAGRTFYANSAGQMGTQVPAGAGTAGVYDDVAQAATKSGPGIFGKVAKFANSGPAMGIQAALYSADVGEGSELTPAQREAKNPGEQADAQKYTKHIQDLAIASRLAAGGDADSPGDVAAARSALDSVQAPAVEETPAGPAVQKDPVTVQQAAAKTQQDTEIKRQQLEQGALKGLSTGAVSRPKIAEAVVEADITRSGKQLTPEAKQRAVTAELTNMKTMDNSDLSKYISYALIAGGVLAVLFDKSGKAAAGFNQGFNKQLDRNMAMGIQNQKNAQAQAKLNQELLIQGEKFKRDDRGLDIKETGVANTGIYQQGQLKLGEGKLSLAEQAEGRQASQGAQSLGLRGASLNLRQQELEYQHGQDEKDYDLRVRQVAQGDTRNAIAAAKVAKASQAGKGVELNEKEAEGFLKQYEDAQGVKVDGDARAAAKASIRAAAKSPEFAKDPVMGTKNILGGGSYVKETVPRFLRSPVEQIRQRKVYDANK